MLKPSAAVPALVLGAFLAVAACGGETVPEESAAPGPSVAASGPTEVKGLKTPAAFAAIADEGERSAALFSEMFKVISHPRCMNCHPRGDTPMQGDAMATHMPPVARGPAGFGVPGMECNACHGATNVAYVGADGSIPGHEPWMLAPVSMGWIGLSQGEICVQLKDETRNGGRDLDALLEHHAEDGLVGWGWAPGEGREPAPGDQETFGALTAAWIEAGAACPGA